MNFYWFTVFYYHAVTHHVVPVYPIGTTDYRDLLMVYAVDPQQATKMAGEIMWADVRYAHHLPYIGSLSCAIEDKDKERWARDHNPRVIDRGKNRGSFKGPLIGMGF